jgi:O-antigen ligase
MPPLRVSLRQPEWLIITGLAFVLLNTILISFGIFYLNLLPLALLLTLLIFLRMEYAIHLIVFFVPFSIPLSELSSLYEFDLSLPTEPMLALVMLIFFIKCLKGQYLNREILRHPVSIAVYTYLAWMFVTSLTSTDIVVSVKFLIARIWFIVAFYFIASRMFAEKKNIHSYLWAFIIPFTLVAIYILINHAGYGLSNQVASHFVVRPFYNDHTSYGATLAMILPVLVGLLILYRKRKVFPTMGLILLMVFFTAATLFSYTRAAWVSLAAVTVLGLILWFRIRWYILFPSALVLFIVLFSLRGEIMNGLALNRQTSSGKISEHVLSIANVQNDVSNRERLNRWNSAWSMFKEKPWFGWGPGTYRFNYAPFQQNRYRTVISTNVGARGNAHSEYLGPLAESGIFGLITTLGVFIAGCITGLRVFLYSRKRKVRILALFILLGLTTYYVHGIVNNFLDTDKISALFWGFNAMLVALDIFYRKRKKTMATV